MGKFFVMSTRFNKQHAEDFGLIPNGNNTALNPADSSLWTRTNLYDFGWGKENGYYREPLPDFLSLFEMTLYSNNKEDAYGAAAVILERYPDELLIKCERIMNDKIHKKDFQKLTAMFKLNIATNRSSVLNKTYAQVQSDFERWRKVSNVANKL